MKKYNIEFPKNFWWGSATAAAQIEGNHNKDGMGEVIWDHYYKNSKNRFFNQKFVENDFYNKYKEDIALAKKANFNSLRISISWARLLPDGKNVNEKAVEFYNNVIDELVKNKIEPFICLFHFDMPMWLQEKGGFTNRDFVEYFSYYSKKVFEIFGSKAKKWFTFNEPIVPIMGGYLYDFHYPNEVDLLKFNKGYWHIVLAHHAAVKEFNRQKIEGEIGVILNINPAIPRSNSKADVEAARIADMYHTTLFLEPFLLGKMPEEYIKFNTKYKQWDKDLVKKGDDELIKNNKITLLGINYYSPGRVKAVDYTPDFTKSTITPSTHFFNPYAMPGRRMNPYRGWEIYPKSIYEVLMDIKENYGNINTFISENGMGVEGEDKYRDKKNKEINDDYRIEFLSEHLYWVSKAINEGANCKGYHMWTYIDNWSWSNAYKNRYGIYELDLKTGKRIPKKSFKWFSKTIKDNKFVVDKDVIKDEIFEG